MKQDIENIIKKNLPEKKEIIQLVMKTGIPIRISDKENYDLDTGFNQALSQINTSLIADEVLKVVVEKIREYYEKFEDNDLNIFESTVLYQTREDILQLLNNLK